MSVSNPAPEIPSTRPASDRRLLTAIKIVLALLLVGFLIVGDNDNTWPVVTWPMFAASGANSPKSISGLRIRVMSAQGQTYTLAAADLSTTLPPNANDHIVTMTFDDSLSASERAAAEAKLGAMVRLALPGVEIAEIQAWKLTWKIASKNRDEIDPDAPDQQTLLGQFAPSAVDGVSQ